jgi:hypothetical protein
VQSYSWRQVLKTSYERLVSTGGTKIADRLTAFFNMLKNSKLSRETLYKFFTNYDDWKGTLTTIKL